MTSLVSLRNHLECALALGVELDKAIADRESLSQKRLPVREREQRDWPLQQEENAARANYQEVAAEVQDLLDSRHWPALLAEIKKVL